MLTVTPTMESCRFQMRMDDWGARTNVICIFQTGGPRFRGAARSVSLDGKADTIGMALVLEAMALADVQRQVAAYRAVTEPYPT
ncbi:hypothetical protein [Variovorax boronicumulans]|uniref:hypothetical protein n=1 Tax=Variovorax boronicumulans TaxID=436515 RepID=UPI0012E420A1|nr:hypothetical protein [Variovorax boronicumulans]GER16696.1 hypothetical protein VCH24_17020 [Variovorax boronicumulans]